MDLKIIPKKLGDLVNLAKDKGFSIYKATKDIRVCKH